MGVTLVTFAILQASGDPVALMMPEAPESDRAVLRQAMGFNDPLPVQFARFVGNIVRGDFGQSFFHRSRRSPLVLARLPTTVLLTLLAMTVSLAIALPIGIVSALRRDSVFDHTATLVVFLGTSMPVFWTGIMLILLFAVQLRVLPVSGWESWAALLLPAATLATFSTPLLLRIVRSSMLEVINLDYVRTARAKGVSEWFVICRHALTNAALPLVTVAGLQFSLNLGGAVITETVFAVPDGPAHHRRDPSARLPHRPGRRVHDRPDGGAGELRGGPAVHLPESADPGALSASWPSAPSRRP